MTDRQPGKLASLDAKREPARVIAELARHSERIFFTRHAEQRMIERGITRQQVLRCLMHGRVVEGPAPDIQGGTKLTLEVLSAGDIVTVVAALDRDASGNLVVVITTYS